MTLVERAPDKQRRHRDAGQLVAEVGLGHRAELLAQRMRPGGDRHRAHEPGGLGGRVGREQTGRQLERARVGGIELPSRCGDAVAQLHRRQRAAPARVGVGEDEGSHEMRMPAVQLERDGAAPGDAADDRPPARRLDERGEAVGVVVEPEALRHVGGAAVPGLVPRDDGAVAREALELRAPRATVVARAVREHERRPGADPLGRDLDGTHAERLHGRHATPGSVWLTVAHMGPTGSATTLGG